jgi:hypothetical protein
MQPPKYQLGQEVFDLPSSQLTTIVEVEGHEDSWFYTVDDNVPLNPTRDGAFPTRDRCEFEICDPKDSAAAIKDFRY